MKKYLLILLFVLFAFSAVSATAEDIKPGMSMTLPNLSFIRVGKDIPAGSYIITLEEDDEVMIFDDVYTKAGNRPIDLNNKMSGSRIYLADGNLMIVQGDITITVAEPLVFE